MDDFEIQDIECKVHSWSEISSQQASAEFMLNILKDIAYVVKIQRKRVIHNFINT